VSQEALLLDLSPNVQFMLAALRAVAGVHSHVDTALIARHLDSLQGFSPLEWASRLMGLSPRKASHQSPQLSPSTSRHDCTPPKPHNSMVDSTLAWLRRLRSLPILEAFDAIAEGLKLPTSPGELPYLSALRDMVHSFSSEQGSTLAAFIQRYQEQDASKRMLPLSQSSSSVNVLTIHKAKGLEFKAVICPEVDWDIIALPSLQTEIIWAPPVGPELENLLLPTRLSLGNGNSNSPLHAPAVLEEHCLAGADALNLLYVAFTRAKDWLSIIYAPKGKKTEKSSVKSTQAGKKTNGRTYTQLLESALAAIGWDCEEEADTHVKYSLGRFSATPSAPSDTPIAIRPPSREERPLFATTPLPIRISIPERNTLEYEQATRRRAARTLGESLHALLQAANKAEDIAAGIAALSASGMLKPEAASQLIATIGQMAGEPPLAHLFSGDYTAIAERDILAQDGQTHRPDRIAISESETLVVDFKFGRPQASHSRQVARYCQLLQELGYARPQGYLWYLRPDTGQGALVEVPATP
jgi:helicase